MLQIPHTLLIRRLSAFGLPLPAAAIAFTHENVKTSLTARGKNSRFYNEFTQHSGAQGARVPPLTKPAAPFKIPPVPSYAISPASIHPIPCHPPSKPWLTRVVRAMHHPSPRSLTLIPRAPLMAKSRMFGSAQSFMCPSLAIECAHSDRGSERSEGVRSPSTSTTNQNRGRDVEKDWNCIGGDDEFPIAIIYVGIFGTYILERCMNGRLVPGTVGYMSSLGHEKGSMNWLSRTRE
ncbi:hypothetical protein G7K_5292-t1 [Saitoella complicata NRRL Y-17804]|uniref:Uncharacterized protein n=1 Tax=Saitoella complicata (strain BCRC 22490 / CBS 7301 / JCM 7358 / NBRC 10748 / NRRL Y-17804) TaxID=698492 RepID=A0A0E9NNB3_SAICN|nr:hypothetical protein G7K_5292-t1 [Saitoella complicata NRRL Y-17804]